MLARKCPTSYYGHVTRLQYGPDVPVFLFADLLGPAQSVFSSRAYRQDRRRVARDTALFPVDSFEHVLADGLRRQRDWIVTIEAGCAQPGRWLLGRRDETLQADITKAVRPDRTPNPFHVGTVGDQLSAGREVDAVEARLTHRWAGDADMHLDRSGLTQHPDQRPLRIAAHD